MNFVIFATWFCFGSVGAQTQGLVHLYIFKHFTTELHQSQACHLCFLYWQSRNFSKQL
jgi:hypothetical protein